MVKMPIGESAERQESVEVANRAYKKKIKDWEAINEEMQQKECPVCHRVGTLKPCREQRPGDYFTVYTTHISIYCQSCKVMQRFPMRHITYPNYPKVE